MIKSSIETKKAYTAPEYYILGIEYEATLLSLSGSGEDMDEQEGSWG